MPLLAILSQFEVLLLRDQGDGLYRPGAYRILSDGFGEILIRFDSGTHTFNSPANFTFNVAPERRTSGGVSLRIMKSVRGDHVRNIRVYSPGYHEAGTHGKRPIFTPEYLDAIGRSPKVFRFMDWAHTNSKNVAHWHERQPESASQSARHWRSIEVQSVEGVPGSAFQDDNTLRMVTKRNHGLVTGQQITLSGTNGVLRMRNPQGVVTDESMDLQDRRVEVLGPNVVQFNVHDWRNSDLELVSITPSTRGVMHLETAPGVALEYMVALSNLMAVDPWFCLPHLATDDYARQMGECQIHGQDRVVRHCLSLDPHLSHPPGDHPPPIPVEAWPAIDT